MRRPSLRSSRRIWSRALLGGGPCADPASAAEQRAIVESDSAELSIRRPRTLKDVCAAMHPALASDVVVKYLVGTVGMPTPANEVR